MGTVTTFVWKRDGFCAFGCGGSSPRREAQLLNLCGGWRGSLLLVVVVLHRELQSIEWLLHATLR